MILQYYKKEVASLFNLNSSASFGAIFVKITSRSTKKLVFFVKGSSSIIECIKIRHDRASISTKINVH
jgi:hypothetical protein